MHTKSFFLLFLTSILLSACSGNQEKLEITNERPISAAIKNKNTGNFKVGNPYKVAGKSYTPTETYNFTQTGIASWYGPQFHGKKTANGEIFDMNDLTAAHKTLQIPSIVRVTNLENGRSVVVRINDRGPFKRGRVIDMSKRAAEILQFKNQGTARVKIQLLPEESRKVAEAAKRGDSTQGVELAMNDMPSLDPLEATDITTAQNAIPPSIEVQPLNAPEPITMTQQSISSDAAIQQIPVLPHNIYVQAGSFSEQANAARYAQTLEHLGKVDIYPAEINGQQYFRVRFGPMKDVADADTVLSKLADSGSENAIIIVD